MRRTTESDFNAYKAFANAIRVRVATTSNVTIASALNDGDTLDGVTLAAGDTVLVKDQAVAAENGVYIVAAVPVRHPDFVDYDRHAGLLVTVEEGSAGGDTIWLCTSNRGGAIEATAIDFTPVADTLLSAIAALSMVADRYIYGNGANQVALGTITAFARSILDDANASTVLSTLGVTAYVKTLLNDASAAAARSTLGLGNAAIHNEGSGNGLDADTVDGIHVGQSGARVPRCDQNVVFSGSVSGGGLGTDGGINCTKASGQGYYASSSYAYLNNTSGTVAYINRNGSDGVLLEFRGQNNPEGYISVSGSTINYVSFSGAHFAQMPGWARRELLPGTVLEAVDELAEWYAVEYPEHGETVTDEDAWRRLAHAPTEGPVTVELEYRDGQRTIGGRASGEIAPDDKVRRRAEVVKMANDRLPKCKVSDKPKSRSVYGVFVRFDDNDGPNPTNDLLVAALGSGVVRVRKGETPGLGDYLESAGDGTARVQADDVMRASTIAKVTGTTRVAVYDDGSFLVPCTLHCG